MPSQVEERGERVSPQLRFCPLHGRRYHGHGRGYLLRQRYGGKRRPPLQQSRCDVRLRVPPGPQLEGFPPPLPSRPSSTSVSILASKTGLSEFNRGQQRLFRSFRHLRGEMCSPHRRMGCRDRSNLDLTLRVKNFFGRHRTCASSSRPRGDGPCSARTPSAVSSGKGSGGTGIFLSLLPQTFPLFLAEAHGMAQPYRLHGGRSSFQIVTPWPLPHHVFLLAKSP